MVKNICKAENIDIKKISPKYILAIIDKWKNRGFYPDEVNINKKDIYEKIILPISEFPSAAAQGCIALEYRRDDRKTEKVFYCS